MVNYLLFDLYLRTIEKMDNAANFAGASKTREINKKLKTKRRELERELIELKKKQKRSVKDKDRNVAKVTSTKGTILASFKPRTIPFSYEEAESPSLDVDFGAETQLSNT